MKTPPIGRSKKYSTLSRGSIRQIAAPDYTLTAPQRDCRRFIGETTRLPYHFLSPQANDAERVV